MARIIKPEIEISKEILDQIKTQVDEVGQVIIHCLYTSYYGGDGIRIWPSTYLMDSKSDHVSELVHAENISLFPTWTIVPRGNYLFTLIFSGLPKSCTKFDLIEDCKGSPGAFEILDIKRNSSDVYYVRI